MDFKRLQILETIAGTFAEFYIALFALTYNELAIYLPPKTIYQT